MSYLIRQFTASLSWTYEVNGLVTEKNNKEDIRTVAPTHHCAVIQSHIPISEDPEASQDPSSDYAEDILGIAF